MTSTTRQSTACADDRVIHRMVTAPESNDFQPSLPRVPLDVVRTGLGIGPNVMHSLEFDDLVLAAGTVDFPVVGQATVNDDAMAICLIRSAPRESRWCEYDLRPGMLLVYGPGAEHVATTGVGTSYSIAVVKLRRIAETAEHLGIRYAPPSPDQVWSNEPSDQTAHLNALLEEHIGYEGLVSITNEETQSIVEALTVLLAGSGSRFQAGPHGGINNRHVVTVCTTYVNTIDRMPTMEELCLVAHMSERRLRVAFTSTIRMPPIQYFNLRRLSSARNRLVAADGDDTTVTRIAMDVGFRHMSRFARRYQRTFDELPSSTLNTADANK